MDESMLTPLAIGTIVHERYRVESIVGRGGLGTVYSVLDILFGKHNIYALKEMADQSRSARRQFEHEAQWLQALDHNHIPKVREYYEWRSRLYLVMDFVDGENLEQKLYVQGGRPLAEEQVIAWILPICDALQYLHTRKPSILHRDVKPANIIVTPAGHPVLVDLGIAKEHLPGAGRTATFVRKAGTEGYAPPEQYTTAGKSGPWSDVYALGATLYHLLTARVPVSAIERVTQDPDLVSPRRYNPAISEQCDMAICRAMAMRPSARFQSIAEFASALSGDPVPFNAWDNSSPSKASALASAPGWGDPRAPRSQPHNVPSRPPQRGTLSPYARSGPGGEQSSLPRPPSFEPPRTPSPPPSRNPSFAGGQSPRVPITDYGRNGGMNGMNGMGDIGQADYPLPPLPPETPSIMASVGRQSDPALQMSPRATAAQFQRIRESITGRRRTSSGPRAGGSNRGLMLTGIALVLILIAVGIATAMILPRLAPPDRSSPQATITGYFNALQQEDFARAWQFAAGSRNDTGGQDVFTKNLRADDSRYGRVVSVKVLSVENDSSNHATALIQATRAQNANSPVVYSISLSQYDGTTWLVDSITSQ
jgi:serine/threonine protein kinase